MRSLLKNEKICLLNLFNYHELTINERQGKAREYSETLLRIRVGILTAPDLEVSLNLQFYVQAAENKADPTRLGAESGNN